MVKSSWDEPVQTSCPLECFSIKLKRLTRALQSWGAKRVGHIKTQLALAREVLHRLEVAQDRRTLSIGEDWLRKELKRLCLKLASLERTVARLRSRVRYLKEGDANTSFFHKQAAFWKRKNFISKIIDGGRASIIYLITAISFCPIGIDLDRPYIFFNPSFVNLN